MSGGDTVMQCAVLLLLFLILWITLVNGSVLYESYKMQAQHYYLDEQMYTKVLPEIIKEWRGYAEN